MTTSLSERLHQVVKVSTSEYRRFKELETITGVIADTWKSWFHGRQRPTAEMIEAACKAWPEYAFWITTGATDLHHGHISPLADSWPEKQIEQRHNAVRYLRKAVSFASLDRSTLDDRDVERKQEELRKLNWLRKAEDRDLDTEDQYKEAMMQKTWPAPKPDKGAQQ